MSIAITILKIRLIEIKGQIRGYSEELGRNSMWVKHLKKEYNQIEDAINILNEANKPKRS